MRLETKKLIVLWDRKSWLNKSKKTSIPDGKIALSSLFSIEAKATNPNQRHQKEFARYLPVFLEAMRDYRTWINKKNTELIDEIREENKNINLVPKPTYKHSIGLEIPKERLCRSTGLLIKLFLLTDGYFELMDKMLLNEEIDDERHSALRKEAKNKLQSLLVDICKNAVAIHQHLKAEK